MRFCSRAACGWLADDAVWLCFMRYADDGRRRRRRRSLRICICMAATSVRVLVVCCTCARSGKSDCGYKWVAIEVMALVRAEFCARARPQMRHQRLDATRTGEGAAGARGWLRVRWLALNASEHCTVHNCTGTHAHAHARRSSDYCASRRLAVAVFSSLSYRLNACSSAAAASRRRSLCAST